MTPAGPGLEGQYGLHVTRPRDLPELAGRLLMSFAAWGCLSAALAAQGETAGSPQPPATAPGELTSDAAPATLVVWNRPLAVFRVTLRGATPRQRADSAAARVDSLLDELTAEGIHFTAMQIGSDRGIILQSGPHVLFGILAGDLPQDGADTLEAAGEQAVTRLQLLVVERHTQRSTRELLWDLVKASLASLAAFGLWRALRWLADRVTGRLQALSGHRTDALEQIGLFVRPLILRTLNLMIRLSSLGLTLAIAYVWLAFVLSSFPLTRPWGEKLGSFLFQTLGQLALGAVASIPDLITLTVIFFVTRAVVRLVDGWFASVAQGTYTVSWLTSDAARVTRRLAMIAVWLFATTVAYPYIPGSGSNVFKGATVFIGLMVSLASQGILNQVLSGLVVVHTGALRRGDHVRIGDVIGTVVEVGMVATRINTIVQEEVTVPNAVIVTTSINNYSRHTNFETRGGVALSTTVTIGYDAPWRQVHAMLEEATAATPGIRANPKPFVLQSALSDFYVEYRLYFEIDRADDRPFVLSTLHATIQDRFNAHGVQILSPHFMVQPAQPVSVPRSRWFTAPAHDDGGAGGRSA